MIIVDSKIREHVREDLRGILTEQFGDSLDDFDIDFQGGHPFKVIAHLKDGKTAILSYELNVEQRTTTTTKK